MSERSSTTRTIRAIAFAWACAACTSGVEKRAPDEIDPPASTGLTSIVTPVSSELMSIPLRSRMAPIVEGLLDDDQSAHFLLDTGATISALSIETAQRWGLELTRVPPRRAYTASEPIFFDRMVRLSGITLGDWPLLDFDVAILELPLIEGVIGLNVLREGIVLFDGSLGRILVAPRVESSVEWLRDAYPGRTWTALPLSSFMHGFLVEASIGPQPLRLFLDTGSSATTLSSTLVQLLGVERTGDATFVEHDAAGTREVESAVYQMPQIRLGRWSVDVEGDAWEPSPGTSPDRDGVLGYDILGQVPFILDVRGGQFWILDPLDGVEPLLVSTLDQRWTAAFADSLPMVRILAAQEAASVEAGEWLHELAALLDDDVPDVREAAFESLSTRAGIEWLGMDRMQQAREWCEARLLEEAGTRGRGD